MDGVRYSSTPHYLGRVCDRPGHFITSGYGNLLATGIFILLFPDVSI